jgi:hypothetical protein
MSHITWRTCVADLLADQPVPGCCPREFLSSSVVTTARRLPSGQAARECAAAAVTMSLPWRPGRTAPPSFGGVLVTGAGRRKLDAWSG